MGVMRWGWLVVGTCLAFGCGESESGPKRAEVSGKVIVDGEPLAEGAITFIPTGTNSGSATGAAITNGKYSIPNSGGVVMGKNRVEISGSRKTGRKVPNAMPPGTQREEVVEALPPEVNTKSTLVRDIDSSPMTIDFDLKGTKSPPPVQRK